MSGAAGSVSGAIWPLRLTDSWTHDLMSFLLLTSHRLTIALSAYISHNPDQSLSSSMRKGLMNAAGSHVAHVLHLVPAWKRNGLKLSQH